MRRHPLREIDLHLQPDGQVGVSYVLHRHGEDGERDCSPIVKSLEEWLNSEHAEGYLPKHVLREAFELDWSDPEDPVPAAASSRGLLGDGEVRGPPAHGGVAVPCRACHHT